MQQDSGNEIKLRAACRSLSLGWLPSNPELLSEIRGKLAKDSYKGDASKLLADVKADSALFLSMLRLLIASASKNQETNSSLSPDQIIGGLPFSELSSVLLDPNKIQSAHSFSAISKEQAQQMKEVLISCQASETLSEHAKLPTGLAYSCAILRQLGLTLIAWNYPHVFRHALNKLKKAGDLDTHLLQQLGYSPRMLGIRIAQSWGIPAVLGDALGIDGIGQTRIDSRSAKVQAVGQMVGRMCEVGEALARASRGEDYPGAKEDWNLASSRIERVLGPSGMDLIKTRIGKVLEQYLTGASKGIIAQLSPLAAFEELATTRGNSRRENPYISLCETESKQLLETFYQKLEPGKIDKQNILRLTREVIPDCGFSGGSIYTTEIDIRKLEARFQFGTFYKREKVIEISPLGANTDPVIQAFDSREPIITLQEWVTSEAPSFAAGGFASIQRIGVLYLEIMPDLAAKGNKPILNLFKALLQTLSDTLNLK